MKLAAAVAFVCMSAALAQTPVSPADQDTILSTRSTLIVVPALVRNKAGELVRSIELRLKAYPDLKVTARSSYSPNSEPAIEPHPEK